MNKVSLSIVALAVGGAFGYGIAHWFNTGASSTATSTRQPLYWVAPMDPTYKRDKPGKSPMGMDLVPVYADSQKTQKDAPGTVTINSAVENNMGVQTAQATMGKLSPTIKTVGYVGFDDSQLWQLNLRVSGWVKQTRIHAVGESVKKGQVLFSLYSPELVNAQQELFSAYHSGRKIMIRGARERLGALGLDESQIDDLVRRGHASQTLDIKAPASGVIASLDIRNGSYLTPAKSALSAGPINQVWVDTEIFERQSVWVKPGTPAEMTLASLPGKVWHGKVDYIYPIINPSTRTLRVRVVFDNQSEQLKPNMFANIALKPQSGQAQLLIPSSAVIHADDMTRVVLAEGQGKFRSVRIKTGLQAGDQTAILQGLSDGERVVTSAQFLIDSESSISAELDRINGSASNVSMAKKMDMNSKMNTAEPETAWVHGIVTSIMKDHRMLTIHHQPVKAWHWPVMTMKFTLTDSVPWPQVQVGEPLDFELKKAHGGQYQIIATRMGSAVAAHPWISATITMVMPASQMLSVQHDAVPDLNLTAGKTPLIVSKHIDLSKYHTGQTVQVKLHATAAGYQLDALRAEGGNQ